MNRQIFEGRFLINMSSSIIRQDTFRPMYGRTDWELMYRTAEYHKIANVIYLGLLGSDSKRNARWRERFFERYQSALRYGETCEESEREILALLDMKEIPCTILTSSSIRELYQLKETAANNPLRLFLSGEDYTLAKGLLIDLGYETDRTYKGCGERMKRISGFQVELYHHFPFKPPAYEKHLLQLIGHAPIRSPFQYVRILSLEGEFVFRSAEIAYHYVTDELLIRELLDTYLFYQYWKSEMSDEYIIKGLEDFNIDNLIQLLMQLTKMWFGNKTDSVFGMPSEETEVYDMLENRILSRGKVKNETNPQALYLERVLEQIEKKELNKEKWKKFREHIGDSHSSFRRGLRWLFPDYRYMCGLYPSVEKLPLLLPICWIRRDIRLLFQIVRRK